MNSEEKKRKEKVKIITPNKIIMPLQTAPDKIC